MCASRFDRRRFLARSAGLAAAGAALPGWLADLSYGAPLQNASKATRRRLGAIGVGGQGTGIMRNARNFSDLLAVADVDRKHAERAKGDTQAEIYGDYRKLLERNDIDVVTIGTPDHWHTKVCLDALAAGKDIYCEKPLTLTVAEGQQLVKAVKDSGRVLQVGTQQRSEMDLVFLRAAATVRSGQLGKIKHIVVSLPLSTSVGGPFQGQPVPEELNWEMWQGQAPLADYAPQRCHFEFRWWYEYSGGIATDWGAHHLDIAQWALDAPGPLTIDGSKTVLPAIPGGYNTPKEPRIAYTYPNDVTLELTTGDEFVIFEGDKGRIRVNRGRVTGKPIEAQDADKSLQDVTQKAMTELYKGSKPGNHMRNFFEAVESRQQPISDVESQHRSVTGCHLGNISCRLQRKLTWDAATEKFVGDDEANGMLSREQRAPYQT